MNDDFVLSTTSETRILKKLHYAAETRIIREALLDAQVNSYYDYILDHLVLQIKSYTWTEHLETIRYPANWWQAVKERWFPVRAKERWPVQYEVFDVRAAYPDFRAAVPDRQYWLEIIKRTTR